MPVQIFVWNNEFINYINLNPMNFGVEGVGGIVHPMLKWHYINKGANSLVFTTSVNDQYNIEVPVCRGFRAGVENNTPIATFYLSGM